MWAACGAATVANAGPQDQQEWEVFMSPTPGGVEGIRESWERTAFWRGGFSQLCTPDFIPFRPSRAPIGQTQQEVRGGSSTDGVSTAQSPAQKAGRTGVEYASEGAHKWHPLPCTAMPLLGITQRQWMNEWNIYWGPSISQTYVGVTRLCFLLP